MAEFSMFDENGNPIGVSPPAPMGPTSIGAMFAGQSAPAGIGSFTGGAAPRVPGIAPIVTPAVPVAGGATGAPAAPAAGPVITRLPPTGGPAAAGGGPRPTATGFPGVDDMSTDTAAARRILDQMAAEEEAKRAGYSPGRKETRQDTGGQRQRSMGEAPEITQQVRDLWSGPQPLERIAPPAITYSPVDVLSVSAPPPEAKTPKEKMAWAQQTAADWTKRGVSVGALAAMGALSAPDWRPKNWDKLSGEQQDALERAHRDDPKAIAEAEKRRQLIGMIDARHSQALDATGAANEAARARYDRDVERFGAEGIAGEVTAQAKAQARAEAAASGHSEPVVDDMGEPVLGPDGVPLMRYVPGAAEGKSAADVAFLEKKAELLRGAEDRNKDLMDRINATVADIQSAKIDPGALWNSRSTGQKLALAIATGMGAFAQAMGQGPNTAANIIEKATDDDIKAQIANIDKKKGDLTELQKLYKHTLDVTGDKIAAEDAMRLAAHSAIDARLAEAQQTAKTEIAASKVRELRGRFQLQNTEREAALSERQRGTESVNFKVNPAVAAGYGGGTSLQRLLDIQKQKIALSHGQATVDLALGAASAKGQKQLDDPGVMTLPVKRANGGLDYIEVPLDPRLGPAEQGKAREIARATDAGMGAMQRLAKRHAASTTGIAVLDEDDQQDIDTAGYALAIQAGQGQANKDQIERQTELMRGALKSRGRKAAEDIFTASTQGLVRQYGKKGK